MQQTKGSSHYIRRFFTSKRMSSWLGLLAFLAASAIAATIGSLATMRSVSTWYTELQKPAYTPPNWVFAPVWTVLYILVAVAGWLVWRKCSIKEKKTPFILFGVQLFLNSMWSVLFFGLQTPKGALFELIVLFIFVILTMAAFWPISRRATWLLAPYAAWIAFAGVLNSHIVWLN